MKFHKKIIWGSLSVLLVFSSLIPMTSKSEALSGSDFKAGNIISDAIFFHGNTMGTNQIKSFLQSKVPVCDTNHAESSNPNDSGPPYTCLKNYDKVTPIKAADSYCNRYPGGHFTAARIIYEVGKACGVSQKALIVLIQKEQSLITDTWPWDYQYKFATGFCVYDVGPPPPQCEGTDGFFNQVYYAARQFKKYKKNPQSFNYRKDRKSYVQWHPNSGCGGSYVTMQTHATAGLYNYTPYRPNKAALNNLYGEGNSCSSYGNRNFWRIYNDWFGSTHRITCTSNDSPSDYVYRNYNGGNHRHYFTRYECERDIISYYGNYKYEGIAFRDANLSHANVIPVYRVHDKRSGYRFWTINKNERDYLISKYGWGDDGVGFYAYSRDTSERRPVYRLYHPRLRVHLYTAAKSEIDTAKSHGYKYEGKAFYVPG
jgi:hypothetical protein